MKRNPIHKQLHTQIFIELAGHLTVQANNVTDPATGSVYNQLLFHLRDRLLNQLDSQLNNQLNNQLDRQLRRHVGP